MSRFGREREVLMRNPSQIREVKDCTDPADPIRGEVYSYTHYDVSVCWSRIPAWAGHADAGHCIRHGDVRLDDDPDFVLIGDGSMVMRCTRGNGQVDTFELTDDGEGHALGVLLTAAWQSGMPSIRVNARNGSVDIDLRDVTAIKVEENR